ncbi:HAD hydrolase-like protein [Candidatus Bathyarchaeota archaeon]|nr:HAD hydrolase-like protein [Candidatus Bathyarchaeota archaeon]
MAGTTVDDRINGLPLVLKSYNDAFRNHEVEVPMMVLNAQRGRDKRTVISELGGDKADDIYTDFVSSLKENISKIREMEGAPETFRKLKSKEVSVVVSTGFPVDVAEPLVDHLGWISDGLVDSWICSELVGASRPDPAMILDSMKRYKVDDPGIVIKVDDTMKGIEEGRNASVYTIAVLTGTQSIQQLDGSGPDMILRSVKEIPDHLEKKRML